MIRLPRPLLLGHRGARACKSVPENTFASFDRALADGCDGFEFDVRLTADGQAVVCHDANIGKIAIARATAEHLSTLPRLEDVLHRYNRAFLDIELKVAGLEAIIVENIRRLRLTRFVVSSFLPEVITGLQALNPKLPLALICETKRQLDRWKNLPIEYVIPHYKLVGRDLLKKLRASNKKVLVWTVNSPEGMKRFAKWKVDGILSDDTKLLSATLAGSSAQLNS
jgi:glycerophosphoryl diester phosphodiesterase